MVVLILNPNTFNRLKQLGFSDDEIIKMSKTFKHTLTQSPEKVESVVNELINQGLNNQQTHEFLIHTPSILGKAVTTIRQQFDLYRQIFGNRYIDVLSINPRRLIQGLKTTKNRYAFFVNNNISQEEIEKNLFISKVQFKRKYNCEL
jgi:hypothetical protein